MTSNLIARSSISVNAPIAKVWNSLVNPTVIKQYMFGVEVVSDWKINSPIVWKGEWQGKPYEDKGLGDSTKVTLSQDNNSTQEDLEHSQQMWDTMLAGFKELLES